MRFHLSTLVVATSVVVVTGVLAIPLANTNEEAPVSMDSSNLIPQNFTASDGITYEIWIDAGFISHAQDVTDLDKEKRQTGPRIHLHLRPVTRQWKGKSTDQNKCRHSSFTGDTGPHAPTTDDAWPFKNGHAPIKATGPLGGSPSRRTNIAPSLVVGRVVRRNVSLGQSLCLGAAHTTGCGRVRSWGSADCDGDLVQNGSAELKWWLSERF
ncbi:uncharacterized protein DFL_008014 [Arthrobotrys flagrans]|uniref:Uncharacterized protein n=1 Tax=Arthrobotrys flagrans TaxID=97331 RepID=A0A436ZT27_ARTFL|nr:hypothetical protein DFL_008014 [Arthrobotrys flagrans]